MTTIHSYLSDLGSLSDLGLNFLLRVGWSTCRDWSLIISLHLSILHISLHLGLLHFSLHLGLLHFSLHLGLLHISLHLGLLHISLHLGLLHISLHLSILDISTYYNYYLSKNNNKIDSFNLIVRCCRQFPPIITGKAGQIDIAVCFTSIQKLTNVLPSSNYCWHIFISYLILIVDEVFNFRNRHPYYLTNDHHKKNTQKCQPVSHRKFLENTTK
jgi:hypothetical protein